MGTDNEELLKIIRYYQSGLDKYSTNDDNSKVLSIIKKLKKLPIATSHLEVTGIGRTVNALRKLGGEVGDSSKALVTRWKEMVVQEDVKTKDNTNKGSPIENLYKSETDSDRHDENENSYVEPKRKEGDGSSSHKSSDNQVKISLDKRNREDKHSSKHKYNRDNSSERYTIRSPDQCSDNSESEKSNRPQTKRYRSDSDKDEENISSGEEKCNEKHVNKGISSTGSSSEKKDNNEEISSKRRKHDTNRTERISSKRKRHSSNSSESEENNYERRNKGESKSRRDNSDKEDRDSKQKKEVDKRNRSSHKSSHDTKDSRDKERSSKKYKYDHDSSKRHNSQRNGSSSSSDSDEKNHKSDVRNRSDSESDNVEEEQRHNSKKSNGLESEDNRKHYKSKSSKSDKQDGSSNKSKSKDKTESKSSKVKSSSRTDTSKKELDGDERKSSSKYKDKSNDDSSETEELQDKSKSKQGKELDRSKESRSQSSHSGKHDKKDKKDRDKDESKDKHSHKDKKHEEKHRSSRDEKEDGKKEMSSTSSSHKNKDTIKSSNSKHKSTSEKKSKPQQAPNTEKIANGIDSESGASFAEALGMCAPVVFSKGASSSKKKPISLPGPEKQSKNTSRSTSVNNERSGVVEKYVPSLLKELPPEPLQLNISSLLPEITPNYKPIAFPLDSQSKRMLTPDEALSQAISNKNLRTKVYSGNKVKGGEVESLFNICVKILQDNLDAMECTGGVPYHILKPILEKATPDQLFNMEHHNPYLIEDTDELWRLHCLKEFRTKKREEMETWRDMYMRCLDEREAKLNTITASIKQSQDKCVPVRTTKLAYIDSVAKPPRNIARKQAKNGIAMNRAPLKTPSSKLSALATSGEAGKVAVPNPGSRAIDRSSSSSSASAIKPKKAPLMAKTLSLLKNRFRR